MNDKLPRTCSIFINYILEKLNILENLKFQNVSGLENYRDNEYGVFFDVVNICVEKLFSINNIKNIYYSKHFVNCLFFFIVLESSLEMMQFSFFISIILKIGS